MTKSAALDEPRTVLLLEDNLAQAVLIRHSLSSVGEEQFRLEHVDTVAAAAERLARGGIDVALIDLTLPDSSGIDTFRAVHQAAPQVPIVVLTGQEDEQLAIETLKQGAQDYLLKNEFRPRLLVRSLRFALERHRAAALESLNQRLQRAQASLTETIGRLKEANEDLAQFTYFASHDLQEPTRKLRHFARLLEEDAGEKLSEQARRDVHFIGESARRMQALVQSLLTLAQAGSAKMKREPVDLDVCVDEVLGNLAPRISATGAQIFRDPLPRVPGDATLLIQLYQNLIGNALKFTSDRAPVVRLGAQRQGNEWLLSVGDNGIGIAPEHLQRVFAPFERMHGRSRYEGTGIGLAICKKVVERHQGHIWVESEPGKGSTFKFLLPAAMASTNEHTDGFPRSSSRRPRLQKPRRPQEAPVATHGVADVSDSHTPQEDMP